MDTLHTHCVGAMNSSCARLVPCLLPPLNTQTPPVMFVSSLPRLWIPHEVFAPEECGSIQHFKLKNRHTAHHPLCTSCRDALVKPILRYELPRTGSAKERLCVLESTPTTINCLQLYDCVIAFKVKI